MSVGQPAPRVARPGASAGASNLLTSSSRVKASRLRSKLLTKTKHSSGDKWVQRMDGMRRNEMGCEGGAERLHEPRAGELVGRGAWVASLELVLDVASLKPRGVTRADRRRRVVEVRVRASLLADTGSIQQCQWCCRSYSRI